MDDSVLIDEVVELTLACQQGDATDGERARLERLLADDPRSIIWYLRVVEDTLTLRDATSAHRADNRSAAGSAGMENLAAESAADRGQVFKLPARWLLRMSAGLAAACMLFALAGAWWWSSAREVAARANRMPEGQFAQIVSLANVQWSDEARRYDEWSLVNPGESLTFESGNVNLYLANGAEVRIEGPADVELVSLQKVLAREGKLAARVGPRAIGFCIETPHANVIDRGTSFGLSIDKDCRTAVVVYEGMVDLDVLGDLTQPRRRLATGEALSVDRDGRLSRITAVQSGDFLEPALAASMNDRRDSVIATVTDNVGSLETKKYYRIVPRGFREDCRAYVDRLHEWNGLDERGLPPFLAGGDYVMTFNDDKIVTGIEIAVGISQPANVYVLIDDRVPLPEWLSRDFVDTGWNLGADNGWEVVEGEDGIVAGMGTGQSIDHVCSIWRREVFEPTTVVLGALSRKKPAAGMAVEWSMYGVVATPLNRR